MIEKIIDFTIKQRLFVHGLVALLLLIGVGLYSLKHLPIDAVPDVTTNQVQINTEVHGLGPVDVEKLVTFPIESAMSGLPYVDEIRSLSKSALSQVTVVFADDVDIYFARQLVLERLQIAEERIPAGIGQPVMGPISTGLGEIYQYTIEGKDYSTMELRTIHDWIIRFQLLTTPGITEINSFGGFVKQYQVLIDPAKLVSYRIPLRQVFESLAKNNVNAGGAYIEHASEQYTIRGIGLIKTIADIENIIVDVDEESGTPIFIKNLASVVVGPEVRYGAVTKDGKGEVVTGIAMMLKGENSRTVVNRLKKKMEEIKPSLPAGVTINPFYDRTDLVNKTIRTVRDNLTSGIILVVVVLILLLGNWRGALLVAFSIPLTALFTFSAMYQAGIAASLMSLGALDFGIIVDGSVVMVENIVRHLSLKQKGSNDIIKTIHTSAQEVGRPIFFAVIIIFIVYLPIATLQGMEGKMFKPMAFTMMFAMAGSLIIAITVIPVLCSFVFKKGVAALKEENRTIRFIKKGYLPLLHKTVDHPRITILIAALCFFSSLALVPRLGSEFIPELDEGALAIHAIRLPSVSLTQSTLLTTKIEQSLMKFPEVKTVVSKTGRAEIATDPMGQELTDVFVILKPRKEWKSAKNKEELINLMEKELNRIPGMRYSFSQPIEMRVAELIAGVRSDIAIKLFGDDLEILKEKAEDIEHAVAAVHGAVDVKAEQVAGLPVLQINIDRAAIARYGINVSDVQDVIETAIGGKRASEVLEGQMRFDLIARFPSKARESIEAIKNILISSPSGINVPMSQLANIQVVEGPAQISREDAQRRIVVECNVRGRDIGSFVAEAQRKIKEDVTLPSGYFITWGGQFENMQRARMRLAIVVPVALFLIFVLLYTTFRSVKNTLLIYINIPIAATGGIVALYLRGMPFSISAGVGFIILFGLTVLASVVMISFINELRQGGMSTKEAVITGAGTRLRPILMTVSTDIIGFLPMAVSMGMGAEVQKPLATVIICGEAFSTLLTLFVLPALYLWFERSEA